MRKGDDGGAALAAAGGASAVVDEDPESPDDGGGNPGEQRRRRTPLKTVLQNFLNHVETLEAAKSEGEDTYEKEFQQLKSFSDSLKSLPDFSTKEGEREVNRKKNRYKDILPFDATRVILSEYPGVPGSDYINANYVKGASGSNAYIAAQGPLPHTVNDFWRMVVEAEVQVVVMACNETEAGKHKCECYWSDSNNEDEEKQFGKFFVKTLKMREICPDFLVRTMRLRWEEGDRREERTVCQFHYSAWPDHGIPTQVKPLLEMVRLIRDCQASETLPVLVHCSAGCGRTGTICAIDFIWGLLRTGKLTADFSLFELVKDMRRQRVAMVQTADQYILVHRAVRELFLEQLRVIDAHPYENVDGDGNPLASGGSSSEQITPDYETVFVASGEQVQGDIDRVLSQRMARTVVMGTAMLGGTGVGSKNGGSGNHNNSVSSSSSSSPPEPPPKQRSVADPEVVTTIIDTRRVDVGAKDSSSELAPVEKFVSSSGVDKSPPSLFEPAQPPRDSNKDAAAQRFKKGNLRLKRTDNGEWRLEEVDEKPPKKAEGKKKKKKDEESSSKSDLLLRRPSIKRFRAFFNKDKDTSSKDTTPSPPTDEAESPQSDSEIAAALSKLPKFETNSAGTSGYDQDNEAATLSKSVPNSLDRRSVRRDPDYANVEQMFHPSQMENSVNNNSKTGSSNLGRAKPRQESPPKTLRSSLSSDKLVDEEGRSKNSNRKPSLPVKRSKSVKQTSLSSKGVDKDRDLLEKLHARVSSADPDVPEDLKRTLPLIAQSSNSLDDEARRMLRDCQHYLMASFDAAERESERLQQVLRTSKGNRSAESSPMTTLHKKGNGCVFATAASSSSSHSSPSNSYNKYSKVLSSPPGTIQKSVSSPTGTIQKSFCSPASSNNIRPRQQPKSTTDDNVATSSKQQHPQSSPDYANMGFLSDTAEPQGKVTAVVAVPNGSPVDNVQRPRGERRNSFREAVEKRQSETEEVNDEQKKKYESIWFKGEQEKENGTSVHKSPVNARAGVVGLPRKSPRESTYSNVQQQTKSNGSASLREPRENGTYANMRNHKSPREENAYANMQHQQSSSFVDGAGGVFPRQSPRERNNYDLDNGVPLRKKSPPQQVSYTSMQQLQQQQRAQPQQAPVNRRLMEPSGPYGIGQRFDITNDTGYEPITFNPTPSASASRLRGSPMSRSHHQLQSVGLVSEVLNKSMLNNNSRQPLVKTESNASLQALAGTKPPPPYKEPPQPRVTATSTWRPQHSTNNHPAQLRLNQTTSSFLQSLPLQPAVDSSVNENPNAYVNVQVNRRQSRETARSSTKDDSALSVRRRGGGKRSASLATNRMSLGDFSMFIMNTQQQQSLPANNINVPHGLTVKPADTYIMMPGSGEAISSSTVEQPMSSPPGIDLDALAARMIQNKDHTASSSLVSSTAGHQQSTSNKTLLGRSLAGVFSGAAANLRSKLNNFHSSSEDANREMPSASIPVTVPGASDMKKQTYGYPHRLEVRPMGPREAPNFKRKQEYL